MAIEAYTNTYGIFVQMMKELDLFGFFALIGANMMLLAKIFIDRDCIGISVKTQLLYLIAFTVRSLASSLTHFYFTPEDSIMMVLSWGIPISMLIYYKSHQNEYDKFSHIYLLILSSFTLGLQCNKVFWASSVYLEAVAIIPQLYFCSKAKKVETSTYYYIILLILYKFICIMSEIFRYNTHKYYNWNTITLAAGFIQLLLYIEVISIKNSDNEEEANSDVETRNEQLGTFDVHPKEAEAARSATATAAMNHGNFSDDMFFPTTPNGDYVNITPVPTFAK